MNEAFAAMVLGISLAAPVGPISLEMIKKGITNGFNSSLAVGLGGMTADVIFMVFIYFGLAHFLMLSPVQIGLYFFGSLLLLYLGYQSINHRHFQFKQTNDTKRESLLLIPYTTGLSIALINPVNLMFWFGIYGSVLAEMASELKVTHFLQHASFMFLGIFLWNVSLSILASCGSTFLKAKLLPLINIIAGICLLFFGFHFSFKLAQLLFYVFSFSSHTFL